MDQKKVFKQIFLITAILLAVLPTLVLFSSMLTALFSHMGWYVWLQQVVVPVEARFVAVLIKPLGIKAQIAQGQDYALLLQKSTSDFLPVRLEWNCLGWQSLVMLGITLITGLWGRYKLLGKLEVVVFGILGTFIVNLLRMAFIVSLAFYWNGLAAVIVHDYFAALVSLIWMLFYWWFSYSFILEEKIRKDTG